MTWPGLTKDVNEYVKHCKQCQINKSPRLKYGHLPVRNNIPNPWEVVCVDLIGPYTININNKEEQLLAITICDPATGWFEIAQISDKKSTTTAKF